MRDLERLAGHFPTLRGAPGVEPWDAEELLRWLCTSPAATHGGAHAAAFLLQVYNPGVDWREHAQELGLEAHGALPFNLVEAFAAWDRTHRAGLRAWTEAPFFP